MGFFYGASLAARQNRSPVFISFAPTSAACVSFRRLIADRSFLRQYRKLHAPLLLGFLDARKVFRSVEQPRPSASAAGAVALAADFDFDFLPASSRDWIVQDVRDGRVLLDKPHYQLYPDWDRRFLVSREIAVCDPLHRRYLVLPRIHEKLVAPTMEEVLWKGEAFLIPADNDEETSFRVAWMVQGKTTLFLLVFSSSTGQWRAVPSRSWTDLFAGLVSSIENALFYFRKYAYGCCFWVTDSTYWREEMKMLVFDTRRMEFSVAEPPPEAKSSSDWGINVAMVEAGEGRPGMCVLESTPSGISLHYTIMQNSDGSSGQWQREKTLSLSPGSWSLLAGSAGSYVILLRSRKPSFQPSCSTLDIKTFTFKRVCGEQSGYAYSNFPPLLLSSPTVSSGTKGGAEKETL